MRTNDAVSSSDSHTLNPNPLCARSSWRFLSRSTATVAILVLMGGLGVTGAPLVTADDDLSTVGDSPSTVSAAPEGATTPEGGIVCSIKTNNPHGSTHNSGNINVESQVVCKMNDQKTNVASLTTQTQLWRLNPLTRMATGKQQTNQNKHTIESDAATPCVTQRYEYYGIGVAEIVFPPKYKPALRR